MNRLFLLALTILLASCATVEKIESGEQVLGNRLTLTAHGWWNQIRSHEFHPAQLWTMDGRPIDQLLIYSGVADGKIIHTTNGNASPTDVSFDRDMKNKELVTMFAKLLKRDESEFHLDGTEPFLFDGRNGIRFDFHRVRGSDGLIQSGVGFAVVDKGALFALVYFAPRLGFFPRHMDLIESMVRSARIR